MGVVYKANATGLLDCCTREYHTESPNYYPYRYPNTGIGIHHGATTNFESMAARFAQPEQNASSHYGVKDGRWTNYVSEKHSSWTGDCEWSHNNLISIECVNSEYGGNWKVSDKTFDTCARLMADIAIRHGWSKLKHGVNVWGHRDLTKYGADPTVCPGPYLYSNIDRLCDLANKYIQSKGDWFSMATQSDLEKAVSKVLTTRHKLSSPKAKPQDKGASMQNQIDHIDGKLNMVIENMQMLNDKLGVDYEYDRAGL